jgi:hypothetical protein
MRRLRLAALAVLLPAVLGVPGASVLRAGTSDAPASGPGTGKCAGAGVTVDVAATAVEGDTLTASGTWTATGTADGVLLELRVQSNLFHSELQHGTAGRFAYETDSRRCGVRVVRLFAYPSVSEGGREIQCLTRGRSAAKPVEVDCTPSARILRCAWDCAGDPSPGCAGTCTGAAQGGEMGLVGFWGVGGDEAAVEGPPNGPWTAVVRCKPGERVTFRVRDGGGKGRVSAAAEAPCGE